VSRRRLLGAVLATAVLAAGGCGRSDGGPEPTAGKKVKQLEMALLPGELVGLQIRREDVSATVADVDATYLSGLGLWSLRAAPDAPGDDGLLQATLQVSRFNAAARPESNEFRQTVVNQIGSSKPKALRLGRRTVYLTTGTKQAIAVWFKKDHLFVLASRADYEEPRNLLRAALEVEPA
jgi:hypothetical protein